jgi:hypothetical protein
MRRLICLLVLSVVVVCRAESTIISKDVASGRTYYHLLFTLTPTNSSLVVPIAYTNECYRIERTAACDDYGGFEVYIRASSFPVPTPGCNGGWIILRMGETDYGGSYADDKIDAKKELWKRLQKMYETGTGAVDVVIELNPYVRVNDASVPKLELEYCNVFFRQAYGEYIPYVGALKLTNNFPVEKLPATWPATDNNGWAKGADSSEMLHRWFSRASKKPLGTEIDTAVIKKNVLADLKDYSHPSVSEIRWLSPKLVMVIAGWYEGPEGGGAFYYILEKNGSEWEIINHYLICVS